MLRRGRCSSSWLSVARKKWRGRRVPDYNSAISVAPEQRGLAQDGEGAEYLHVCWLCPPEARRTFQNAKALKTHQMRAPGNHSAGFRFIAAGDATCPFGAKSFPSSAKARDHLNYRSKGCMAKAQDAPSRTRADTKKMHPSRTRADTKKMHPSRSGAQRRASPSVPRVADP